MLHTSATLPLPRTFPKTEIGLMTAKEFLKFKNPQDKYHDNDSYEYSIESMNKDWDETYLGRFGYGRTEYVLFKKGKGYVIKPYDRGYYDGSGTKVVGAVFGGIVYYDLYSKDLKDYLSGLKDKVISYWDGLQTTKDIQRGSIPFRGFKQVKYLPEILGRLTNKAQRNLKEYPHILKRFTVKGEEFTLRSERKPGPKNKGSQFTIAILNSDGLRVGYAADEWGATLITVALEYRGYGFGRLLGTYWYKLNPYSQSGGFTYRGEENALGVWRGRVAEFLANGWYSELLKRRKISSDKLKTILSDFKRLGGRGKKLDSLDKFLEDLATKRKSKLLVYSNSDSSIILYDYLFLENPSEKYIYGHVHFGYRPNVGYYIYSIDYDSKYKDMTLRAALQMAKDLGEPLYNGEGYRDFYEVKNIPGIQRKNNYIYVNQDLFPLKRLSAEERDIRKRLDPYDEIYHLLFSEAESKW